MSKKIFIWLPATFLLATVSIADAQQANVADFGLGELNRVR